MSKYYQEAFSGGMNILENDTRLAPNEYRLALNLRNRFGKLTPIKNGVLDTAAPKGIKQDIRTFGNFVILFVAGFCYYRRFDESGWQKIVGFQMSTIAERFWTEAVPVTTLGFLRKAVSTDAKAGATWDNLTGAFGGNVSGLVVQDNINQPQLVYIDPITQQPTARTLQTYAQWMWNDGGSGIAFITDNREYVPIGNSMAWVDGVLYITSQDFETIYHSVSGRPLDFVVNITAAGSAGGDATTTAYSVGVGGISCLRAMSSNALFVAASNANFAVSKNTTPGAPTLFGEYTFIRTFLFNAVCLSDRAIIDSLGDTRFIDVTGLRSFNAVQQLQNEGRNSQFSMKVQAAFNDIVQLPGQSAAILYDNYEYYGVNTIFGPAIAIFDTINGCWVAFDTEQTGGSLIKMFAKIELTIQRLYAITVDNEIYTLQFGDTYNALLRILSVSPDTLTIAAQKIPDKWDHKLTAVRMLFSNVIADFTASLTPIAQNELTKTGTVTKPITYTPPALTYTGLGQLDDIGTNLKPVLFSIPDCAQACQSYAIISWTGSASLTQFDIECVDINPMNSLRSQS
jgi:hypothetical protein